MKYSKSLSFFVVITFFAFLLLISSTLKFQADAAGRAMTLTPSTGEVTAATATDVSFNYVASSTQFATGNTVTFVVSPSVTALAACNTPTTNADTDATPDGAFGAYTTSGVTYTFTARTTLASTTGVTFCLKITAAAGIYSVSFSDNNDGDYGSALVYSGDRNDVTVTAQVSTALAFAIRTSADNADTNACALGTLSLANVNTCSYRLKVTTNNSTGYTVSITSNGDLSKNGTGNVADADDIDNIAENSTVVAGTEGHGIALAAGTVTKAGGVVTEAGDYADDDTPVPFGSTQTLYSTNALNSPTSTDTANTALVTHRASMDGSTETGSYTQTVTYYAALAF